MTAVTVRSVDSGQPDGDAPPLGTAIVRPLRHVQAVRARHAQQFTDPDKLATSRSGRAWAWALGESTIAPVTDRSTAVPPSRSEIETEIAVADQRRAGGDREGRADAAATILRWLIGDDDHIPVRGENRGELVGGFGDVVRSREQITSALQLATGGQLGGASQARDVALVSSERQLAQQEADYLGGVVATLAWIVGRQSETPITRLAHRELTTRNLKSERIHADDVIERARNLWIDDERLSPCYCKGVKDSITWLLGDSAIQPLNLAGKGHVARQ